MVVPGGWAVSYERGTPVDAGLGNAGLGIGGPALGWVIAWGSRFNAHLSGQFGRVIGRQGTIIFIAYK